MLDVLAITNYRSIRDLVLPLSPLTVITGANGTVDEVLHRLPTTALVCASQSLDVEV